MLSVRDLVVDIQGSRVLRGVSLEVKAGELVCLVGRNGAGKTTTFRTVMGFRKPVAGAISLSGQSLIGLRPFRVARLGVGFAPEESEVFGELNVAENIALPTWTCPGGRSAEARLRNRHRGLDRPRAGAHKHTKSSWRLTKNRPLLFRRARSVARRPR